MSLLWDWNKSTDYNTYLINIFVQTLCSDRGSGCWRWPYGSSTGIHHLQMNTLCIDCCDGQETENLCNCQQIVTFDDILHCCK